ncbi:class I SAM-dependent methyltransferase [Pararhodospirillum oryzae]|uniref:SAM-dependent methyltransferase n=1 Tax=Pararhodospirillum oryzae TaxID=478448 RepID=A0A512H9Q4_9PROT|nr:class I SAM-dependent methyltransferase [Pararhodospirillum oryzae]GEO82184.1 hypothetical protein ROR02_23150 [Pararhodospirillum oryzae]
MPENPTLHPWMLLQGQGDPLVYPPDYAPVHLLDVALHPPRTVLDVGCFTGAMGQAVKKRHPDCRVVGIEPRDSAAAIARTRLDGVFNGLFEAFDFAAAGLDQGRLDTVILADVLEHMPNPWGALQTLRSHLAPTGQMLVSLPNIRNLYILANLADGGQFAYEPSGILDITHLRFFTRRTMIAMFAQTGFVVQRLHVMPDGRCSSLLNDPTIKETGRVRVGRLQLDGLSPEDVLELAALQFFFAVTPA